MKRLLAALFVSYSVAIPGARGAVRLKELVTLEGVRDNQLMGYGLIVGLAGTGDRRQTVFSAQSLTNFWSAWDSPWTPPPSRSRTPRLLW